MVDDEGTKGQQRGDECDDGPVERERRFQERMEQRETEDHEEQSVNGAYDSDRRRHARHIL